MNIWPSRRFSWQQESHERVVNTFTKQPCQPSGQVDQHMSIHLPSNTTHLNWQQRHRYRCYHKQGCGDEDRSVRLRSCSAARGRGRRNLDDWRQDAGDAVEGGADGVAGAAVRGGEDLQGVSVLIYTAPVV